uniref:Uncharacterized protein n=1 Tax=Aquila chrysaetos chrysaetos TaxID=223781 RepID=A0A663EVN7_AQUCH
MHHYHATDLAEISLHLRTEKEDTLPLGTLIPAGARLHGQRELVALQRVAAHVCVLGRAQGKPGAGKSQLVDLQLETVLQEARGVVVDVLDGHLDVENVERVLHQRLEADEAGRRLAAHLLPVQPLAHVEVPGLPAHAEVLLLGAEPQLACRQVGRAQPQVPRQRPHQRASAQLLGDGVADPDVKPKGRGPELRPMSLYMPGREEQSTELCRLFALCTF